MELEVDPCSGNNFIDLFDADYAGEKNDFPAFCEVRVLGLKRALFCIIAQPGSFVNVQFAQRFTKWDPDFCATFSIQNVDKGVHWVYNEYIR